MGDTLLGSVFTLHEAKQHAPSQQVLNDLRDLVKRCQTKYGGKKELATDEDDLIVKLCNSWEAVLSHGLKAPHTSVLKNVQDIVSGNSTEATFWDVFQVHLTNHERERYESLQHVWTNRGKTKALIRSALNERSLERYILMWLADPSLKNIYEPWACLLDNETVNLLPSMAAGLSSILFSIIADTPTINVTKTDLRKTEPVIAAPRAVGPSKKSVRVKRQIVSFDDKPTVDFSNLNNGNNDSSTYLSTSPITTIYGREDYVAAPIDIESYFPKPEVVFPDDNDILHSEDEALTKSSPSVSNTTAEVSTSSCHSEDRFSVESSNSSTDSKNNATVALLEERIKELTERCTFLESRVASLSLENCNLRRLVNMNNKSLEFIVSIPRVVLLRSGARKYYAYHIHVNSTNGLDEWTTLRRYSEFYKLHSLHKENPSVKALDFPPKKALGNMDISFVEDRRQRLQVYLRHLLAILPDVISCKTRAELQSKFPFLK